MSSFAGWISHGTDISTKEDLIHKMANSLKRNDLRIPGLWITPTAALISDYSEVEKKQINSNPAPYRTPQGDIVAVCNGVLSNSHELAEKLKDRGYPTHASTYSNLILTAYIEWGEHFAEHIEGAFATAIWDERRQTLLLCRDRIGIETVYYYKSQNDVLFGSEIKSILANPIYDKVVDANGLRHLFSQPLTLGNSVWKDVYEVIPGTVVKFERARVTSRTYWELQDDVDDVDSSTSVEFIRDLLKQASNTACLMQVK